MARSRYIVIPNWDELQHYRDRDPVWIKTYVRLLHRDEYRELTGNRRAILHGLWLLYAITGQELAENTASISSQLAVKVTRRDLEALRKAGFITFSASKPLARRYQDASPEKRREDKEKTTPLPPSDKSKSSANGTSPLEPLPELTKEEIAANVKRVKALQRKALK